MTENRDVERELIAEVAQLRMELALANQRLDSAEKKLENLSTGVGRGLWVFFGSLISAFVAWVAGGGLAR